MDEYPEQRPDPSEMNWDPTAGMTPEERIGYEMVRTLEGRLVTDDTFRAHSRSIDRAFNSLRKQLRYTRVVAGVAGVLLAVVALWGWDSAQVAKQAAEETRQVADCNDYILNAVANRKVNPRAELEGCDMTVARVIIERSLETSASNEKRLTELERRTGVSTR